MSQSNIKVAFDEQIFIMQRYGGISRYFSNIAHEMRVVEGVNAKIIAPLHRNVYAAGLAKESISGVSICNVPKSGFISRIFSPILSKSALDKFSPQIIHETYYRRAATGCGGKIRVITVFDMIHELFPSQFNDAAEFTTIKRRAVERAQHVFCISEKTRSDLINIFGVDRSKTSVTYLGVDELQINHFESENVRGRRRPYILYIGNRGGYKNFACLLKAFRLSRRIYDDFRIICFGGGRFTDKERRQIAANGLTELHIEQQEGEDAKLALAYRDASVLVYPSLYEGFGIPPLEAMSAGCPVVASNKSSIPEVVGGAAELFDPYEIDSLINAIENVVFSEERRKELVALGYKRYQKFSWLKCAEETVGVYRNLI